MPLFGLNMNKAISVLSTELSRILCGNFDSLWLYGSVIFDDFRLGWSDIDFVALSSAPISDDQAQELLTLRQKLSGKHPDNPYFRLFEGIIVCKDELLRNNCAKGVYWGTSGQRIAEKCALDTFARFELAKHGRLTAGENTSNPFTLPTEEEIRTAVKAHLQGIRQYAKVTDESLYSCGWLLDIARCIYTLRFHDVISKTQAGKWALKEHLFRDEAPLVKTLEIRENPLAYKDREDVKKWLSSLGQIVQEYADVLELGARD